MNWSLVVGSFIGSAVGTCAARLMLDQLQARWRRRRRPVLWIGQTGGGKSLAAAAAIEGSRRPGFLYWWKGEGKPAAPPGDAAGFDAPGWRGW